MSFEEPNDPRSCQIVNNQIQLTELVTYEERTPGREDVVFRLKITENLGKDMALTDADAQKQLRGVEVYNDDNGKIKVSNILESRLELVAQQVFHNQRK